VHSTIKHTFPDKKSLRLFAVGESSLIRRHPHCSIHPYLRICWTVLRPLWILVNQVLFPLMLQLSKDKILFMYSRLQSRSLLCSILIFDYISLVSVAGG